MHVHIVNQWGKYHTLYSVHYPKQSIKKSAILSIPKLIQLLDVQLPMLAAISLSTAIPTKLD